MRKRQPLPTVWMMSDERMGADFLAALSRMPRGSGLIFRHYATPPAERRALFEMARRLCKARRMLLLLAGTPKLAAGWRADGVHIRQPHRVARPLLRTAPVHDAREARAARQAGAALAFVSPVWPTRSHPGAKPLSRARLARLARRCGIPVIALGGMTSRRFKRLKLKDIIGWSAIDAHL